MTYNSSEPERPFTILLEDIGGVAGQCRCLMNLGGSNANDNRTFINGVLYAAKFYETLGFVKTGEFTNNGEVICKITV